VLDAGCLAPLCPSQNCKLNGRNPAPQPKNCKLNGRNLTVKGELSDLGYLDCCRIGWYCPAEKYWRDYHNTEKISLPPLQQLIEAIPTWREEIVAQKAQKDSILGEMSAARAILRKGVTEEETVLLLLKITKTLFVMVADMYPPPPQ
jgi:hypothetical protein